MDNRRTFLKATLATAAMPRSGHSANDRVRMGLIGCGTRGTMVSGFLNRHDDCVFVAACDVAKTKLDATAAKLAKNGVTVDTYGDYRRILDRKDIDAVLI